MTKMRPETKRLRDLFDRARVVAIRPDSAPALVQTMLSNIDLIHADEQLHRHLLAIGLNHEVKLLLSRHRADEEAPATQARLDQIEQWPLHVQGFIQQIDRAAVFVPSRNEHVELVPDAISREEMVEAGEHLVAHGEDCLRRGKALVRVAELIAEQAA